MANVHGTLSGMNAMGELVKAGREAQGYATQKALADAMRKDGSWVSKLERGEMKEMVPPDELNKLARLIRVPTVDLLVAAGYDLGDATPPAPRSADERALLALVPQVPVERLDVALGLLRTLVAWRGGAAPP